MSCTKPFAISSIFETGGWGGGVGVAVVWKEVLPIGKDSWGWVSVCKVRNYGLAVIMLKQNIDVVSVH
jgi:hypothetical protein